MVRDSTVNMQSPRTGPVVYCVLDTYFALFLFLLDLFLLKHCHCGKTPLESIGWTGHDERCVARDDVCGPVHRGSWWSILVLANSQESRNIFEREGCILGLGSIA